MERFVTDDKAEAHTILTAWFRRRGQRRQRRLDGQIVPVRSPGPRLNNGDRVYEKFPVVTESRGTIIKTYIFAGEYRHVVRFEDGREGVLFEKELLSA